MVHGKKKTLNSNHLLASNHPIFIGYTPDLPLSRLLEEEERYGELRSFEAQVVLLFSPSETWTVVESTFQTANFPMRLRKLKSLNSMEV